MDKKLKKDFQKKIIRNRDVPEKNLESKLVHSDDYTNKIIKTKDRFGCLLYTSPSPRDLSTSRMPSSA